MESTGITMQTEDQNNSMKLPLPNEMFLLNACEQVIAKDVQFYFKSYQEFITSDNQKLIAVISALNAADVGCYNDLRIKYPGFILEPPPTHDIFLHNFFKGKEGNNSLCC